MKTIITTVKILALVALISAGCYAAGWIKATDKADAEARAFRQTLIKSGLAGYNRTTGAFELADYSLPLPESLPAPARKDTKRSK